MKVIHIKRYQKRKLAVAFEAKTVESGFVFAKAEKEKFAFADGSMIKGWDIGSELVWGQ